MPMLRGESVEGFVSGIPYSFSPTSAKGGGLRPGVLTSDAESPELELLLVRSKTDI